MLSKLLLNSAIRSTSHRCLAISTFKNADSYKVIIKGHKLPIADLELMDYMDPKSDPYLKIFSPDGKSILYQTEVIDSTLNPKWKPFTISAENLKEIENSSTRVEVWDEDITQDDEYMCSASFKFGDVKDGERHKIPLFNEEAEEGEDKKAGRLSIKMVALESADESLEKLALWVELRIVQVNYGGTNKNK